MWTKPDVRTVLCAGYVGPEDHDRRPGEPDGPGRQEQERPALPQAHRHPRFRGRQDLQETVQETARPRQARLRQRCTGRVDHSLVFCWDLV
jgi:hypothetical protein